MSTDVRLITEIGSTLAFVVTLFILYRTLSDQKDARIALLEEKVKWLRDQLDAALLARPDLLARSLSERVNLLEAELQRRRGDSSTDQERINETSRELTATRTQLAEFQRQLGVAEKIVGDLFCPYCRAPISDRTTGGGTVSTDYGEYDVDWEDTYYECGLHLHDGEELEPCNRPAAG